MDSTRNFSAANGGDGGLTALLQNGTDAQKEALLRATLAALGGQQAPAPQARVSNNSGTAAAVLSALSAAAPQANSNTTTNNEAALRTLLLLQQQQQAAAPDLQGLARLRAAPGLEGLLMAAAPRPAAPPANLDLLRLRAAINGTSTTTNSNGDLLGRFNARNTQQDYLEQARLLSALNTHQQALANVEESERRLALLLGGANAGAAAPTPAAASLTSSSSPPEVPPPAPAVAVAAKVSKRGEDPPAASPSAGGLQTDAQKLAALEQLGADPSKMCMPCLPPVEEGNTCHWSQRVIVPLGVEEDSNWLSERQSFIRADLLEVVRASHAEVLVRSSSKSIAYQQVGIRCRYCAHLPTGSRAIRASAFPSSIRQMYQSFTMMVRDHFGNCIGVPPDKKQRFIKLKGLTSPSSSLSRQYWTFAARKLGMKDSEYGIMINEESVAEAQKIPPFGTSPEETKAIQDAGVTLMVEERDQNGISPYLYFLLSQAQVVSLLPSERVGKRKDAAVGLPGFGCTHCAKVGRLGFCRMFPLNKRSLPDKVNDLYNHMIRCPKCPRMTKRLLESRRAELETNRVFAERDRDFIDRIWIKLGRDCDQAFKKP